MVVGGDVNSGDGDDEEIPNCRKSRLDGWETLYGANLVVGSNSGSRHTVLDPKTVRFDSSTDEPTSSPRA